MKRNEVLQYILFFVLIAFILGLFQGQAIPQDLSYHNFADNCNHFGTPNFWNVISNLPFLFCGILFFKLRKNSELFFKSITLLMGIGFISTGLGSAYYHLEPNNHTLVWDRIPMTIVFVSFFLLLVHESVSKTIAKYTLVPLLISGILSVLYWIYTENQGAGDLRWYVIIQFYPLLATFIILIASWRSIKGRLWILVAFLFYMVAKIFETQLDEIFFINYHFSGHSIKHLSSACSGTALYYWVKKTIQH
jgi:hypothetical protein